MQRGDPLSHPPPGEEAEGTKAAQDTASLFSNPIPPWVAHGTTKGENELLVTEMAARNGLRHTQAAPALPKKLSRLPPPFASDLLLHNKGPGDIRKVLECYRSGKVSHLEVME